MKLTEYIREQFDREVEKSRHVLQAAPTGKFDWKPHERSMAFGYLANMVATIPTWLVMEIDQDELDIAPKEGSQMEQKRLDSAEEFVKALDESAEQFRKSLAATTDEHLKTSWQLLAGGHVVMDELRYVMIQDSINHWIHHRGQMTVYLRLMGEKVPAVYGPSADENSFD